jgi:Skp family chaperone for outer membrane proteins
MKLGFLKSQEEKIKEWTDEKLKEETQKARKELETLTKSLDSNKSTSFFAFGSAGEGYKEGLKLRKNQAEKKLKLYEEELKRREQKPI